MNRDETDNAIYWFVKNAPHPVPASVVSRELGDTLGLTYTQVRTDLERRVRAGRLVKSRDEDPQHRVAKLMGWRTVYEVR